MKDTSLAVIITAYKRQERLIECLKYLAESVRDFELPTRVVIMDSSPTQSLSSALRQGFIHCSELPSIEYAYYRSANQSQLRNKGIKLIESYCPRYVLFLDSDIYLGRRTLKFCVDFLTRNHSIAAVAPPMIAYFGGPHKQATKGFGRIIERSKHGLIMPSKMDFRLFSPCREKFIESHMLRGAFIIRRSCLRECFDDIPWHESFEVWQNVDMFLSFREMGKVFGYILDSQAACLHDERAHPDTLRSWMPRFHEQTIKSIILLFHRNRLWRPDKQTLNKRFLETIRPVIAEHCDTTQESFLETMFDIARCLSLSTTRQKTHDRLRRIRLRTSVMEIAGAIDLLLNDSWIDIRSIRSHDIDRQM